MALTISLFQRPGSILFLDDDPHYLEMLGMAVPDHWQAELYAHPWAFGRHMNHEPARWEADAAWQLQMIDRWRQGQPLLPQVLRYWAEHPQRYQLAKTCVVDYAMPGTNGLIILDTLLDWPGSRVLLTGQADEQVAVQAFNNGLIDQYIPKQAPDITRHLLSVIRKLALAPHPRLNTLWRAALRPAQQSVLQIPAVSRALQTFTEQHWVEYVVLGEPFGLLGLTADGTCQWLQLEPHDSLGELAELAASAGMGFDVARDIRKGTRLALVEVHQQLALPGPIATAPTLPMGDDTALRAALFTLPTAALPQPILSYRQHLETCGPRVIRDA
ncbi:MAG: response regulator [Hydrogenophaga sp.]|jgi:CheY-like chemotaxis protein|nr:response regulator [Hydrogenophaga sp.]